MTFVEAIPAIAARYARGTLRLTAVLQQVALALGGSAGARLTPCLGLRVSGETLLRLIRRSMPPVGGTPRIVGIDDWAFRKGHHYGTIIVDLERRRPIDLLPDRTVPNVAAWLQRHPEIEVVARDRSPDYARAIREGAPQAVQVADRWHVLVNLREALERFLDCIHGQLRALPGELGPTTQAEPAPEEGADAPVVYARSPQEATRRQARRARRRAQYDTLRLLYEQGWSILELAQHFGMSRVTVRRYVKASAFAERAPHRPRRSILNPYLPYLEAQWEAGHRNGLQLWREVQTQGFTGSTKRLY